MRERSLKRTLPWDVMEACVSRPIGTVDSSLKSTKVDIEILLAAVASKRTRVTGSGISAKKIEKEREGERKKVSE